MTQEYLTDGEIDHYIQRMLSQCANPNYDIYPWLRRQLAQGLVVVKVDDRRGIALYGNRHRGKPHAWVLFDDSVTKSVRLLPRQNQSWNLRHNGRDFERDS
jgi:hypothetical protein